MLMKFVLLILKAKYQNVIYIRSLLAKIIGECFVAFIIKHPENREEEPTLHLWPKISPKYKGNCQMLWQQFLPNAVINNNSPPNILMTIFDQFIMAIMDNHWKRPLWHNHLLSHTCLTIISIGRNCKSLVKKSQDCAQLR